MKYFFYRLFFLLLAAGVTVPVAAQKQIYEIRTYRMKKPEQLQATEAYLQQAYLPALHRMGIRQIGVFKPVANDTATVKTIYVLVPYASLTSWQQTATALPADHTYQSAGLAFLHADTAHLPFQRMESTLVEAFPDQPTLIPPSGVTAETVYELRSYESPTEHLHERKVTMFNEGKEIPIFKKLGFNAVFYGDVLIGSRMPNLMYMVVFDNEAAHTAHWKAFGADPDWKAVSGNPVYENAVSVSHIESILMHRATYSDL